MNKIYVNTMTLVVVCITVFFMYGASSTVIDTVLSFYAIDKIKEGCWSEVSVPSWGILESNTGKSIIFMPYDEHRVCLTEQDKLAILSDNSLFDKKKEDKINYAISTTMFVIITSVVSYLSIIYFRKVALGTQPISNSVKIGDESNE